MALEEYAISKQLTKRPEDYPDAKVQAHVQVRNCCAMLASSAAAFCNLPDCRVTPICILYSKK